MTRPSLTRIAVFTGLGLLALAVVIPVVFPRIEQPRVVYPTPDDPHKLTAGDVAARAAATSTSVDPYVTITAKDLFAAYDANEIAAEQRFKNARVRVDGIIDDIGTDLLGTPYITLKASDFWSVQAMFPRSAKSQLASLAKGRPQTVRCESVSKLGNVILRNCSLGR